MSGKTLLRPFGIRASNKFRFLRYSPSDLLNTSRSAISIAGSFNRILVFTCGVLILQAKCSACEEPIPPDENQAATAQSMIAVVRPLEWSPWMAEWKSYRESQGYEVIEIDAELGREGSIQKIREIAARADGKLNAVLLAGDVNPTATQTRIPTFYERSEALVQFGGDAEIASDNPYGDLNGDHRPELAVGRIPADTPEQLRNVLARVIAYENTDDFSSWRRDVHVIAGVGGFGLLADSVIEMTTRRFLAERIPAWSNLSMTQASIDSLYCPDPFRFGEACIDRFNQGGMFWVYIGHGHVKTLDYLKLKRRLIPILTSEQLPTFNCRKRSPIALFLACYTGAFDVQEDSLAERLVIQQGGPIASLAASRVSGPYGLAMLSDGLLDGYYNQRMATFGEIVLHAKQKMFLQPEDDAAQSSHGLESEAEGKASVLGQRQLLSAIASALVPADYDLQAERTEHVWQMNLLGDPLLRIRQPHRVQLDVPNRVAPGESITVQGICEIAGDIHVEIGLQRGEVHDRTRSILVDSETLDGRAAYQIRYEQANKRVFQHKILPKSMPGKFRCELAIPADTPRGNYMARVFVEGEGGWAAGATVVSVRPPRVD